jgi:SAM-dependent methyltransferase
MGNEITSQTGKPDDKIETTAQDRSNKEGGGNLFSELGPVWVVDELYAGLLGRAADAAGRRCYADMLASGRSLADILVDFVQSEEFFHRYVYLNAERYQGDTQRVVNNLLLGPKLPPLLHQVRVELIRTELPEARKVLDLGGAHSSDPQGALLAMGFPPRADEIVIVDLLPQERFYSTGELNTEYIIGSTKVSYRYQSMSDLSNFPNDAFDLIWSGETIEHIDRDEAMRMLPQIRRILKSEGIFALDTPNRTLTRLQVGDNHVIHPEHRYEYRFEELVEELHKAGFLIKQTKGLVHLRKSLTDQKFYAQEFIEKCSINDYPEESYIFFVACAKDMRGGGE